MTPDPESSIQALPWKPCSAWGIRPSWRTPRRRPCSGWRPRPPGRRSHPRCWPTGKLLWTNQELMNWWLESMANLTKLRVTQVLQETDFRSGVRKVIDNVPIIVTWNWLRSFVFWLTHLYIDLADEPLGAVDEEVPLPVAEEHVLAEVPLQHRDQRLLRHL